MVVYLVFMTLVAAVSGVSNYITLTMLLNMEAHSDSNGASLMTSLESYRYMVVSILCMMGTGVMAVTAGDQAEDLLAIFDNFSTVADTSGTSLFIDLSVHFVINLATFVADVVMTLGGMFYGIVILGTQLNWSEDVP